MEFGGLVTISLCFDVGKHFTSLVGMDSSQKEILVKDFKVQLGFVTDVDDEEDDKDKDSDTERGKGDEDKSGLDEEKDETEDSGGKKGKKMKTTYLMKRKKENFGCLVLGTNYMKLTSFLSRMEDWQSGKMYIVGLSSVHI